MNKNAGVTLTADRMDAAVQEAMAAVALTDFDQAPAWSWHLTQDAIELLGELPPLGSVRHRPLMLIGGAALFNLRILIRGLGVHPAVRAVPDPARRDLVAVMRLEGPRPVTADDRALADAVLMGVNEHHPNVQPSVPPPATGLIAALRRAAKVEQTWLAVQPALEGALPGIDGRGVEGAPASTMLIVGTVLDGPVARLQAGQAAQRVVVTAAMAGVPVRPLPAVLNRPADRQVVREFIGGGLWPQVALGSSAEERPPGSSRM